MRELISQTDGTATPLDAGLTENEAKAATVSSTRVLVTIRGLSM